MAVIIDFKTREKWKGPGTKSRKCPAKTAVGHIRRVDGMQPIGMITDRIVRGLARA